MLDVLDTFIGLITIYLVLSLVVTAIGEVISSFANFRGATLFRIVENLLCKEKALEVFTHDEVRSQCAPVGLPLLSLPYLWYARFTGKSDTTNRILAGRIKHGDQYFRLPSYLAPELFSHALLDTLINPPNEAGNTIKKPHSLNNINRALDAGKKVGAEAYLVTLHGMWVEAGYQPGPFKQSMITWFDRTADRANGWFKRRLSKYLFLVGLLIAVALNADSLQMFDALSNNPELRKQMVDTATSLETMNVQFDESGEMTGKICESEDTGQICEQGALADRLFPSLLPVLGWEDAKVSLQTTCWFPGGEPCAKESPVYLWNLEWILKFLGFLLTAAAVSLGAPFWFDLLHKIIQVRGKIATSTGAAQPGKQQARGSAAVIEAPQAKMLVQASTVDGLDLHNISSFDTKSYGYSLVNLFWSARLAKLAYEDSTMVEQQLQEYGVEGEIINHPETDTQCLLVRTPSMLMMSFRGTEQTPQDWLTDAHVGLTEPRLLYSDQDASDGCRVHSGFFQALFCARLSLETGEVTEDTASAWQLVTAKLSADDKNLPIWISGHSLGGALAVLAALKLSNAGYTIAALHTFGQPRVGNQALIDKIDEALGHKYYRSINHADIVPRVPFPKTPNPLNDFEIQEYAHAGRVIYFNDLGQAMMDPPIWYRGINAIGIDLGFLNRSMNKQDLDHDEQIAEAESEWQKRLEVPKQKLRELAGDHGMDQYLRLHRSLLASANSPDQSASG